MATDIPLYVLVNEFTFSAAETVAASIEELGRGTTVGSLTLAKELCKIRLSYKTIICLNTIGHWFTPVKVSYDGIDFALR
ncbi:MAG: S41 family peptidase [Chloroflexota bacterium]